jgi:siroheme synthase (precorrin-2 oxidase/ferrochelatase)
MPAMREASYATSWTIPSTAISLILQSSAVVRWQIAISTNVRGPCARGRLRRELRQQFGPEGSAWVEHVGRTRRKFLDEKIPTRTLRRRLLEIASPEAFRKFQRNTRGENHEERIHRASSSSLTS